MYLNKCLCCDSRGHTMDSCSYLYTSVWHMMIGKRMETKVCFFIASRRPSEHTYEKDSERNTFRHFMEENFSCVEFCIFWEAWKQTINTLNLSITKLSLKSLVTEDSCIIGEPNISLYSTCPSTALFSFGMVWSVRIVPVHFINLLMISIFLWRLSSLFLLHLR